MNGYAIVILAALLAEFGLGALAEVLNLRALGSELPPEFRDAYDAGRYRDAQAYTRARTRYSLVVSAFDLVLVLAFWWAGGFRWLDLRTRALGVGPVPTGLAFIGALLVAHTVIHLPFRWYSTFVLETRFGFNRTTPRTFWTDTVKGVALGIVLGAPLLAAVLWFFERTGDVAWLWCWLAAALFVVVVQFVAPTWIMPLFNRFTPLADGPLRDAILAYARAVAFPLDGVFVIDGSRRSTKGNAFFTGFGRHKRIALFDTLLESLDPREILAVLAHEIGHWKRRHVQTGMLLGVAQMGFLFFCLSLVLGQRGLFAAFGVDTPSVHAGLVFFALLFAPIDLVVSVVLHALSRRHEFEADAFASTTTGTGEALASGLKRLSVDTLANLTPHPLYVALHYSHPPILARVRALAGQPTV